MDQMHDDDARITELAEIFQAKAKARSHADDPQAFVRLAYIAKSALDRLLGPRNPYSIELVELCDELEASTLPEFDAATASGLPDRYRTAAGLLRNAALQRIHDA
ncbi:hypothetical protein [Xylophilus sp. GOD-11R]|uniref:hypothetical protein n=1 Tax=Xylophilus sp. GOD-11R TaxID=3089814 RepID=UPI00298D2906|nr:hypothetical protein [Xylophilus sp. GOD-11R]WPB58133.1 hypothetical protein R9X41_05710 [Xylophilus sp. GOD-11R]